MTRLKFVLLAAVFPLALMADENLIKNGDFSRGSSSWRGKRNIEYETAAEENKICQIEIDDDDDIEFWQSMRTSRLKDLTLTFKIKKSPDYKGRGYQIRFIRPDGSYTYMTRPVPKNDSWKEMEIKFSDLKKSSQIDLKFIVRSGESGWLAFDDIVVVGE